jgi:methylenetetrahydrofolate dehydrogenase (NADP+) / methenyltetrahydrofolate cyclohydrolase
LNFNESAKILDGKMLATKILLELKEKINALPAHAEKPQLVILQVAGDAASSIYVKHKLTQAASVGIQARHILFPESIAFEALSTVIDELNHDQSVHGILLQLPIPPHLCDKTLLNLIDPKKDVDGLTALNLGYLTQQQKALYPCTPLGIMRLLNFYNISVIRKHVVIVNASPLVGKPLAMLMLAEGATTTLCNSKTQNLAAHIGVADIVVSATGKPKIIDSTWLKSGAIIVDVGVYRTEQGLVGDFELSSAKTRASWLSPVPGGVGPMTVAMLMENVYHAYLHQLI